MEDAALLIAAACFIALLVVLYVCITSAVVPKALHPDKKIDLVLIDKVVLSHDTRRFRFALPSPRHVLGLPTGQHISLSYVEDGKVQSRSYTPTSSDHDVGYVDFVIKVYFKDVHPKFPEGGKVSQYLESLSFGNTITAQGPKGRLTYKGNGEFEIRLKKSQGGGIATKKIRHVGMLAGGTGITPMLQISDAIFREGSGDTTKISLLFANQSEDDILCREAIEATKKKQGKKFNLWYTVDRPSDSWKYSSGFINTEMIRDHMPAPGPDTLILMCGPPPMLKFACMPALEELGYTDDMIFAF